MDKNLMQQALQAVLGEGYEARSRATGLGSTKSPSPHDFLQGRTEVAKSNPSGGDMHVPTTMGGEKPKKKAKFKAVEYVSKADKPKGVLTPAQRKEKSERIQTRVAQGSNVLGLAAGGLGTAAALRDPRFEEGGKIAGKLVQYGEKIPQPISSKGGKAGAALAGGALLTQGANIVGDAVTSVVLARGAKKDKKKTGVMKRLDPEPTTITFSKVDDEKQMVFGWCSVAKRADGTQVVDLQGDMIDIEEIEKSAYDYMLYSRKGGNMHRRTADDEVHHIGDCVESMVFTPDKIEKLGLPENFPQGWWYGMKIHDRDDWEDVKSGKRAGFSIHGKGRREPIEKNASAQTTAGPGQIGYQPKTRRQRIESGALGTAGAVAAGSGLGAVAAPVAAKKGLLKPATAEKVKGKLAAVGGVVGGAAGVYGGINAAKTAAAPVLPAKDKMGTKVKKAWSPVVESKSSEFRRQRRAEGYQRELAGGAALAGGGAVQQGLKARKAKKAVIKPEAVRAQQQGEYRKMRVGFQMEAADTRAGYAQKKAAKPLYGAADKSRESKHLKGLNAMGEKHLGEKKARMDSIARSASESNAKNLASAAKHSRRAGKLAVAGATLAGGSEVVRRKRKGSWKPYPGVR